MGNQTDQPLPNALVVDDEKEVADAYALRLRGLCSVETVYSGANALSTVTDSDVDVLLLDRHMPGMSGDEVLTGLEEQGFDGRIIMVTAIDPNFDILNMPFDDYLCKPVEREDVRAAVEQQCQVLGYETLGEFFSVESKRTVIESELPEEERDNHEEYQEAVERANRLEDRARRLLDDPSEMLDTFDTISRESR